MKLDIDLIFMDVELHHMTTSIFRALSHVNLQTDQRNISELAKYLEG